MNDDVPPIAGVEMPAESDELEQWLAKVREKQIKLAASMEQAIEKVRECKLVMDGLSARITRATQELSTLSDRLRKVENDLSRQRGPRGL